jgi:tryptophan synthase alpha chain
VSVTGVGVSGTEDLGRTGVAALDRVFATARTEGRAALIGYLPAGFPSYQGCVAGCQAMVDAGVDVVEVGLPYSDPLMDGPTIQAAADKALAGGTGTADVLRTVEAVANMGVAAVVMSYWNPLERYGIPAFARDLAAAGGAGAITPDLIPDEARPWLDAAAEQRLARVFLVAPSSTDERIRVVAENSSGFIYAASTMGVTGARAAVGDRAETLVARVRQATSTPVAVGLGVSTGEQAAEVAGYADGVIVGSALVRVLLDDPEDFAGLARLTGALADGVRRRTG